MTPLAGPFGATWSLVSARLGLAWDDARAEDVIDFVQARGRALAVPVAGYAAILRDERGGREWDRVAAAFTVSETYFFRHAAQFDALLGDVLPELFARPRSRPVRVLSAGCSTGEEAYSLAMVAGEVGAEFADVSYEVVGIDVNPDVLDIARAGRYGRWSWREKNHFAERHVLGHLSETSSFVVPNECQARVRFEQRGVFDDEGFWEREAFDVVFFRNVGIYFTAAARRAAYERFARVLAPGGALFVGHAETLRDHDDLFSVCPSSGTFYYLPRAPRRVGPAQERRPPRPSLPVASPSARPPVATRSPLPERGAMTALELVADERFAEALDTSAGRTEEDALVRAAIHAAASQIEAAEDACRLSLRDPRCGPSATYILSICAERRGDLPNAMRLATEAARLDPGFAIAYLQIGRLARRIGDARAARHAYGRAVALLPSEDAARIVLFGGGFKRRGLIEVCERQLAAGAA